MANPAGRLGLIGIILAFTVEALGGAYFALFSCGGHVSDRYVFDALAGLSVGFALLVWRPTSGRVLKTTGLVVALVATYAVVEASLHPLYHEPTSSQEYWIIFLQTLEAGPC